LPPSVPIREAVCSKAVRVSVQIPTLNAARYLPKLVPALQEQSLPPEQIVVVDSSSTDGTADLARSLGCVVDTIPRAAFNHGATRNRAAACSAAEVLVFMTQDALPASTDFLATLVEPLRTAPTSLAATFARQAPYPKAPPTERFAREFNYPKIGFRRTKADIARLGIRAFFFSNVASAIRRSAFEAVGRFPATTIANEDMLLCAKLLRADFEIEYVPAAVVFHSHEYSVQQQFQRFFDIGVALERAGKLLEGGEVGGEGLKYLAAQTKFLAETGAWSWLPRSMVEAGAKLCALHLGRRERYLPVSIKRKLSMHSFFWQHAGTEQA